MIVEFDPQQASAVRSVLEVRLGNLSSEIRHTDTPSVRHELQEEREALRALLQKMEDAERPLPG